MLIEKNLIEKAKKAFDGLVTKDAAFCKKFLSLYFRNAKTYGEDGKKFLPLVQICGTETCPEILIYLDEKDEVHFSSSVYGILKNTVDARWKSYFIKWSTEKNIKNWFEENEENLKKNRGGVLSL